MSLSNPHEVSTTALNTTSSIARSIAPPNESIRAKNAYGSSPTMIKKVFSIDMGPRTPVFAEQTVPVLLAHALHGWAQNYEVWAQNLQKWMIQATEICKIPGIPISWYMSHDEIRVELEMPEGPESEALLMAAFLRADRIINPPKHQFAPMPVGFLNQVFSSSPVAQTQNVVSAGALGGSAAVFTSPTPIPGAKRGRGGKVAAGTSRATKSKAAKASAGIKKIAATKRMPSIKKNMAVKVEADDDDDDATIVVTTLASSEATPAKKKKTVARKVQVPKNNNAPVEKGSVASGSASSDGFAVGAEANGGTITLG